MSDPRSNPYTTQRRWSWLMLPLGAMLIASSLIHNTFFPEADAPAWIAAGIAGSLLVLFYIGLEHKNIRASAKQSRTQYLVTALGLNLLFLAMMVVINVLGVRYDTRWDLTEDKKFTLSDQSRSILKSLEEPVQVTAFFQLGDPTGEDFKLLIENAQAETDMLTFELLDPLNEPYKSEQFQITSTYGTVILQQGDDERRLESSFREESFINTLVQLNAGLQHDICFTIGHGELDLNDASEIGTSIFRDALEKQNYTARTINLLREGEVPSNCAATILAGPQNDFQPAELEILAKGVAQGRNLLIMLDPGYTPNLAKDMERYGIIVGDDLVLEQNPKYQIANGDISYVILDTDSLMPHPIFSLRNPMLIMRMVRSVDADPQANGVQAQSIASTTENSWAEQGYAQDEVPSPDLGVERIGHVPIMTASEVIDAEALSILPLETPQPEVEEQTQPEEANAPEEDQPEAEEQNAVDLTPTAPPADADFARQSGAKILVIGSSSIALNSSFAGSPSNLSVLRNIVAWMADETAQLNEGADDDAIPTLQANAIQIMLIWIICVLVAPGFLLVGAINTWWARRSR